MKKDAKIGIVLSFIVGILFDNVDDYIDSVIPLTQIQTYTKYILEIVTIIIAIYLLYFNKETSLPYAYAATLIGLASYIFAFNSIDHYFWYIIIALAIPKFLITLYPTYQGIKSLTKKDYDNLVYIIIPSIIFAFAGVFIENILIPEESSTLKLITRTIAVIILLGLVLLSNKIEELFNFKEEHMNGILCGFYGLLGYAISSSINQFRVYYAPSGNRTPSSRLEGVNVTITPTAQNTI